jgi:hypothetical protein
MTVVAAGQFDSSSVSFAEARALPIRFDQQIVGAGQRCQPTFELFDHGSGRFAAGQRMARNCLDHGEDVSNTMGQFAHQQMLPAIRGPAFRDVAGAFEDKANTVEDLELKPTFDRQFMPFLGLLTQFAGPATLFDQFRLQLARLGGISWRERNDQNAFARLSYFELFCMRSPGLS